MVTYEVSLPLHVYRAYEGGVAAVSITGLRHAHEAEHYRDLLTQVFCDERLEPFVTRHESTEVVRA